MQPLEPRLPTLARAAGDALPALELDAALRAVAHWLRSPLRGSPLQDPLPVCPVVRLAPLPIAVTAVGAGAAECPLVMRELFERLDSPTLKTALLGEIQGRSEHAVANRGL